MVHGRLVTVERVLESVENHSCTLQNWLTWTPFCRFLRCSNLNDIHNFSIFFHVVQPASLWIWSQVSYRFRQYLQQNMDFRVSCSAWTFIFRTLQNLKPNTSFAVPCKKTLRREMPYTRWQVFQLKSKLKISYTLRVAKGCLIACPSHRRTGTHRKHHTHITHKSQPRIARHTSWIITSGFLWFHLFKGSFSYLRLPFSDKMQFWQESKVEMWARQMADSHEVYLSSACEQKRRFHKCLIHTKARAHTHTAFRPCRCMAYPRMTQEYKFI